MCKDGACLSFEEDAATNMKTDNTERSLYEIQEEEANRLWRMKMESLARVEQIMQERRAEKRQHAHKLLQQHGLGGLVIRDTTAVMSIRPNIDAKPDRVLNVIEGEQGMFYYMGQELYVKVIEVDRIRNTIRCQILRDAPNYRAGSVKNFLLGSEYWYGKEVLEKRGPQAPVRRFTPREKTIISLANGEESMPPESPRRKLVPRTVTQNMSPIWLRMLYDAIVEWIAHLRKPKWVRTLEMRDTLIDMAYADERGETEKAIELLHKLEQLHHEG